MPHGSADPSRIRSSSATRRVGTPRDRRVARELRIREPRPLRRPAPRSRGERPLPHAALPLLPALLIAVAAGIAYAWAFPAPNVWILAFPAVGAFLVVLRGRGFWSGALVGLVFGIAFWFTLIDWVTLFLGAVPLVALGSLEALFVALAGGLIAVADRAVPRVWSGRWGRLGLLPLVVAAVWTGREVVAGTFPYGGFAWGRLAESQSTSPFAFLAAWLGLSGLGFVLAWLIAFAVALATEPAGGFAPLRRGRHDRAAAVLPRLAAVLLAVVLLLAVPAFPIRTSGAMRIAAVQPDTHAGYFDPRNDPQANLDATIDTTLPVAGRGADLVVWPEGGSQFDPFEDAGVRGVLDAVAEQVGAPLLTGAITDRDGVYRNSSLLWQAGQGATGLYDKVHPVPFGEYVPDRAFWTPFAPNLLKLISRDYRPGTLSPVLTIGRTRIGVDICFDIVDDGLMLGAVRDGAQVLIGQTNNADFGTTEENRQQLAIARLRAIETGRAIVTDSTVASTTAIGPDGRDLATTTPFRAQAMVVDVPLATGTTPAVAFGVALGAGIAVLGGVLPLLAAVLARPLRPRRRSGA